MRTVHGLLHVVGWPTHDTALQHVRVDARVAFDQVAAIAGSPEVRLGGEIRGAGDQRLSLPVQSGLHSTSLVLPGCFGGPVVGSPAAENASHPQNSPRDMRTQRSDPLLVFFAKSTITVQGLVHVEGSFIVISRSNEFASTRV